MSQLFLKKLQRSPRTIVGVAIEGHVDFICGKPMSAPKAEEIVIVDKENYIMFTKKGIYSSLLKSEKISTACIAKVLVLR